MKQSRITLFLLLAVFIVLAGLIVMQSAQTETLEISPTHENLINNEVDLESRLLFPNLKAIDVRIINIRDPYLDSEVTLVKSEENVWQVISDSRELANQDSAQSVALTLERIPYVARINAEGDIPDGYGLNETDGLILVSAVLSNESIETFLVGNPVTTDDETRGFYTLVDGRDDVYIVPPEPIMYLVQHLEAFENTQKLDN